MFSIIADKLARDFTCMEFSAGSRKFYDTSNYGTNFVSSSDHCSSESRLVLLSMVRTSIIGVDDTFITPFGNRHGKLQKNDV